MYRYTPKKQILRLLDVPKIERWWETAYSTRNDILREYKIDVSYTLNWILKIDYKGTCFYSLSSRRDIPVRGFLFPSSMFNEEIV